MKFQLLFVLLALLLPGCITEAERREAATMSKECNSHVTPVLHDLDSYFSLIVKYIREVENENKEVTVTTESFEYKYDKITGYIDENESFLKTVREVDKGIGLKKAALKAVSEYRGLLDEAHTYIMEHYRDSLHPGEALEIKNNLRKFDEELMRIDKEYIDVQHELYEKYK